MIANIALAIQRFTSLLFVNNNHHASDIIELSDFRCDTFGFSIRTIGKIWIHSCYKVSYLWGYLWSRIFLLLELENFKVCTNSFNRNWSMQCTVKDGSDLITVNFKGRFFGFRDSARVSFQRNLMKKSLLWTSLKCAEEFRLESLTFPAVSWFNRKEMPSSLLLQNSNNFLYMDSFYISLCVARYVMHGQYRHYDLHPKICQKL